MTRRDCKPTGAKATVFMLAFLGLWPGTTVAGPNTEYLTGSAADRIVHAHQAWGGLGLDTSVRPPNRDPFRLRIKDKYYAKGLGHHANGEILVDLAGQYATFEAEIGVQWQRGRVGSVVFQVFVDDDKRFESRAMSDSDAARFIRVSVAGADELRLVANDAGDGIMCDCADWANARLIRDPKAESRPVVETPDVAPFARVVTWDPARADGARANRTQEFHAADVFLARDVAPADDGTYTVGVSKDGRGCIGLKWIEPRLIRGFVLAFANADAMPPVDGVRVETWRGESPWQGQFKPAKVKIDVHQDQWTFRLDRSGTPGARTGVQMVRWIFPPTARPVVLRRLSAHAILPWRTTELRLELDRPMAGRRGDVEVYNGEILAPINAGSSFRCHWDLAGPLQLTLRYGKPRRWKPDRTVLRLRLPDATFGVAVADVLANECVYVPQAGLFVTRVPATIDLDGYRKQIADRKTVLQRVRDMPDQTFARAMAKVHNPVQDNGPMMLSLACDNRKIVVERDGTIHFETFSDRADQPVPDYGKYTCRLIPRFGSGKDQSVARHLHGDWLPVHVTTVKEGGVVYRQRTFVAPCDEGPPPYSPGWLNRRPMCVAAFAIENPQAAPADVSVVLTFLADAKERHAADVQPAPRGAVVRKGERLLAFVDATQAGPLRTDIKDGDVVLAGALPAKTTVRCTVRLPGWPANANATSRFADGAKLLEAVETYWQAVIAPAMQIDVPDPLLMNVIRASQVHCLLAARNEAGGERIAAWAGADRYGPLESEANSVIRGMGLMGHDAFAQRALDYHIHRYNKAGYLTVGYTIMGTGWHLWTLADHYDRTRDKAWLKRVAPEVARVCDWIAKQCAKTRGLDGRGRKMPEHGLVPPGVAADWNRFAYRYIQEGHYCAGLRDAARALAEIGHPQADKLQRDAVAFADDILRAYRWTQGRSPVLPLSNGTWVPAYPSMVYCLGRLEDMIPGEDGNRSWCYDVELGAHHLAALGIIDPRDPQVGRMLDHMEDVWFLHTGMGDYPAEKNHADWFNLGGFAKVQPYYARNAELYALRDDVKPFVRSYFNTIPSLLNTENLSFWEHFHNRGAWHKPHETGYFLAQTRLMLVAERGDDLWLAPFVTNNWLKDGMTVAVRDAPTRFGKVSYKITSCVGKGHIDATIEPPTRRPPKRIVVRLRHPDGKPMRAVLVNGKPHRDFDTTRSCVRMTPAAGPMTVRAMF